MPRKNRVTPFGTLEAHSSRGLFMGNRGDLHTADGTIGRDRRRDESRWIVCRLDEGIAGSVVFDRPGRYTPLFFAAGHRPCAACRRIDFRRWADAWRVARGFHPDHPIRVGEIDAELATARGDGEGERPAARWADLPDGVFVTAADAPDVPLLRWRGAAHAWTHAGYADPVARHPDETVRLLTPLPTVDVLRAGYRPRVALEAGPADA